MAINKTTAGTYRVDFRDQHGRRLRKTFDRLEDARNFNKQSIGDISKGDFVAPHDVTVKGSSLKPGTSGKTMPARIAMVTLHNWRIDIDKHILPSLATPGFKAQRFSDAGFINCRSNGRRCASSSTDVSNTCPRAIAI